MRPGGCGCRWPGGASAAAWYDEHRDVWEHPALASFFGPLPAVIASLMRGDPVDETARQAACAYSRFLPATAALGGLVATAAGAGAAIGTVTTAVGGIPFGAIAAASATIAAVAGALAPLATALCERRQFSATDAARAASVAAKEGPNMASQDFPAAALAAARIAGAAAPTVLRPSSGAPPGVSAVQAAMRARAEAAQAAAKAAATAGAVERAKIIARAQARGCAESGICPSVDLCGEIWASPSVSRELAACRTGSPQTAAPPPASSGSKAGPLLAALAAWQLLR
jgi:hypothetical protein